MRRWILAVGPLAVIGAVVAPSCGPVEPETEGHVAVAQGKADLGPLAEFASYRAWHKANPSPIPMSDVVALMCRNLTKEEADEMRAKDPHIAVQEQKSFTVYVNKVGQERLTGGQGGEFPVGTVIVKEKHNGDDPASSELLTVMVKREKGFSRDVGDWEFLVLDGFAKSIQTRGKLELCVSCHTSVSDNDFVFADYVKGRESVPTKHFTTDFAWTRP